MSQRTDADILLASVNSHSWQAPVPQPPVLVILRTTHIRLTIITIKDTNLGQSENVFCILMDAKMPPEDCSYGWHQIVYVYSSMTSNIILAPNLNPFWNMRQSVMT